MYATLDQVKASNAINVAGVSSDSPEFLRYVNEAVRRLMRRGDWASTTPLIRTCVRKGCVVFPRYVGSVRRINKCGSPLDMRGLWYDFLPRETFCGDVCHATFTGRSPVYQDIWGEGWYVRAYIDSPLDVNKTVTLFGEDNNGQPYTETLTLTASPNAYVQSSRYVRRIDRVIKSVTTGLVRLYAYSPTTLAMVDLAVYEQSETNPSYPKYRLAVGCCSGVGASTTSGNPCGELSSITALIKLQFIPVSVGSDLVLIKNVDAIKDMISSIRCGEAGDENGKATFEASAIRELNLELSDELPDSQIPVTIEPLGGFGLGSQQCF